MPHFVKPTLVFSCLLLSVCAGAQGYDNVGNGSMGFGLPFGFLNAKNSFASGIALSFDYNILKFNKSSLSLGTNLKFGYVNPYGLGSLLFLAQNANLDPNLELGELPAMIHYNFASRERGRIKKFGFYFGGGID